MKSDMWSPSVNECQYCGQLFWAARSDKEYCTMECRQAAHRSIVLGRVREKAPLWSSWDAPDDSIIDVRLTHAGSN